MSFQPFPACQYAGKETLERGQVSEVGRQIGRERLILLEGRLKIVGDAASISTWL